MKVGGAELLAENLVLLIDQVRPVDFVTARVNQQETAMPWTFRIHDVGDFFSTEYVRAWIMAARQRSLCRFWFYTRSFQTADLFDALTELASLPNCKGWLSIDADNYEAGILAYCQAKPNPWGLALLQDDPKRLPPDMVPRLENESVGRGGVINFPKHHAGRHVPVVATDSFVTCPQVLGAYKLQTNPAHIRPCQSCALCLPE